MLPSVYLDTSVLSYLTARPSRDLVAAGRQQVTRDWWRMAPRHFALVASPLVVKEARAGNPQTARARLTLLDGVALLKSPSAVADLMDKLQERGAVPSKAVDDAAHIAIAAVNRVDYLVTWNFKHIANPAQLPIIDRVLRELDHKPVIICTPDALMEVPYGKPTGGSDSG